MIILAEGLSEIGIKSGRLGSARLAMEMQLGLDSRSDWIMGKLCGMGIGQARLLVSTVRHMSRNGKSE